jgi:formylglycine-generating enzyme required for sulfatase activity
MPRLALHAVAVALSGLSWVTPASFAVSAPQELVPILGGTFVMGRDGGPAEEAPAHRLVLSPFRLQRRKVTNAEFAAFLNASGPRGPDGRRYDDDDADARIHRRDGRWIAEAGFEQHPAVEVSWFGARDFCTWKGWRLPSEAEWERAARGADGRPYPWGPTRPMAELAVFGRAYNATERGDARPAGRSPEGIEDLLGNLREWTATALVPYPWVRTAFTGAERVVVRGASHDDPAESLSATRRRDYDRRGAAAGHHHVGFRCATDENSGGRTR